MPKKSHINQLELEFTKRRDDLKKAVDSFGEAATKLAEASTRNPEAHASVDDEMKEMRTTINRLVRILADQSGLSFHTVWVLAYHELSEQTGFHAVAASGGKGKHLDAAQAAGRLPDLKKAVTGMLTKKEYAPGGTTR